MRIYLSAILKPLPVGPAEEQGGGSPQLYYHDCSGRIPGQSPSDHKGATGRVRTGDQLLPILCHCQLGHDIPEHLTPARLPAVRLLELVLGRFGQSDLQDLDCLGLGCRIAGLKGVKRARKQAGRLVAEHGFR